MRLLVLLQGKVPEDQVGYHDGFNTLVGENLLDYYRAMPYGVCNTAEDWNRLYDKAEEIVNEQRIDTVLLQFFHGNNILSPEEFIRKLRNSIPGIIVIATCGDPFGRFFNQLPASMLKAARFSDITFFTGMGYMAQTAASAGAKNVVLMPNGCCQVRFGLNNAPLPESSPEFDLIFIGSNNGGRNPFNHLSISGRLRSLMVDRLERRYGRRFVLYGHNWKNHPSWQGPIPYNDQVSAMRRSRLVIGGFPGVRVPYYTSDRFFNSLVSGKPFLDFRVPRVDRLLVAGEDWYPYEDIEGLMRLIDRLLDADQAELKNKAQACRNTVLARHTQYHRCRDMLAIANRLREYRARGLDIGPQLPDCFHDQVVTAEELPFAVLNWRG